MAKEKETREKEKAPASEKKKGPIALKDHSVHFGDDYKRVIKIGDDLSDVPEFLHDALRAEKVIE